MKCLKHIWPFKRTYTLLKSTDLWRLLHHFKSNSNSDSSLFLPLAENGLLGLLFWTCKAGMFAARVLERGLEGAEKGLSLFFFSLDPEFSVLFCYKHSCGVILHPPGSWGMHAVYQLCTWHSSTTSGNQRIGQTKNTVACQTRLMKHATARDLECQQQPIFLATLFNSLNWLDSSNWNNLNCTIWI